MTETLTEVKQDLCSWKGQGDHSSGTCVYSGLPKNVQVDGHCWREYTSYPSSHPIGTVFLPTSVPDSAGAIIESHCLRLAIYLSLSQSQRLDQESIAMIGHFRAIRPPLESIPQIPGLTLGDVLCLSQGKWDSVSRRRRNGCWPGHNWVCPPQMKYSLAHPTCHS